MRTDIPERRAEIEQWISEEMPIVTMARHLGCKHQTLVSWLKRMGIEYAGNRGGKGYKKSNRRIPALDYLKTRHPKSDLARRKLIEDGIKEHACERCGLAEWLGQKVPLELNHIDGNRYNWNFNNLEIICPNCHALEPTHSGKSIGNYTS